MSDNNYFDRQQEDVLHDAFLMIVSDVNDYENIEDVLTNETTFSDEDLSQFR